MGRGNMVSMIKIIWGHIPHILLIIGDIHQQQMPLFINGNQNNAIHFIKQQL